MCTSFNFTTQDGVSIYARTMEWGASDLKSEVVLVPRDTSFTAVLDGGIAGLQWQNRYGFVGINADRLPYASDGMNEAGLTVGVLFYPGFAEYQQPKAAEASATITSVDVANYILGTFATVDEVRQAFPKIRVVRSGDVEKSFGTPLPFHHAVTDATGGSIVIEYTNGTLAIHENKIGVMTNSPNYDWHLLNLRNYANLTPTGASHARTINGVSLAPFGAGTGMLGLPGTSRRRHALFEPLRSFIRWSRQRMLWPA